jgi:hypothetical protein
LKNALAICLLCQVTSITRLMVPVDMEIKELERHEMNQRIPSKYLSFLCNMGRFLACETAALLISLFLIILIGNVAVDMKFDSFSKQYPDIVASDNGNGGFELNGVLIGSAIVSSWVSLPIAVLIHTYIFKKFFIKVPLIISSFFNKLALWNC